MYIDKTHPSSAEWVDAYSDSVAEKVKNMRFSDEYQYPMFTCKDFKSDIDIVQHRPEMDNRVHVQDYLEIIYVKVGEVHLHIAQEDIIANRRSFILVGSRLPHSECAAEGSEVYHILVRSDVIIKNFISLVYEAPLLTTFFTTFILDPSQKHYLVFHMEDDSEVEQCFLAILETFASKGAQCIPILKCQIALLLLYISKQYNPSIGAYSQSSDFSDTVSDILEYIYSNYASVTLSDISRHFSYNPDYISRMIKQNCGVSFKQLLTKYRMDQAAVLLGQTELSINEIALCVGYNSPINFQSAFKKTFNCTPGSYRSRQKRSSGISDAE